MLPHHVPSNLACRGRPAIGADAEEVLRAAAVPVLLVRGLILGA
jgi:hypothetical protein